MPKLWGLRLPNGDIIAAPSEHAAQAKAAELNRFLRLHHTKFKTTPVPWPWPKEQHDISVALWAEPVHIGVTKGGMDLAK